MIAAHFSIFSCFSFKRAALSDFILFVLSPSLKSEAYVFAKGTIVCWNMGDDRMVQLLDLVKPFERE